MKQFKVSAVIPADQLGYVMAFILEAKYELLECQLIAKEPAVPRVRGGSKKGRSRVTEDAVLAVIPLNPATTIHRKDIRKLLPQHTTNAIDGALSGLVSRGVLFRTEPGWYIRAEPVRDVNEAIAEGS